MRIANNRDQVEEILKTAEPSDLTIDGALRSIATPKEATAAPHKESAISVRDQVGSATACDHCGGSTVVPVPNSKSATMLCPTCGGFGVDFIKETQAKIEAQPRRELGTIERMVASEEGREELAEINEEHEEEELHLRIQSRLHDLYYMSRHMTPEEAARRTFSWKAAFIARDVIMERHQRRANREIEQIEAVREWLGDYAQALKDAEARLYEHHGS
jgi:hypothetical protein